MSSEKKKIFEKLITADYNFYVKNHQGQLIYAGTIATDRTSQTILYTLMFVYNSINAIFLFSLLLFLSWQATALIILLGVLYIIVTREVSRRVIHKCAVIRTEENQRKNIVLNEFITGIKSIKIFLAFHEWEKSHAQAVNGELTNQFRMTVAEIIPETFLKFLFYLVIGLTGIFFSQRSHQEIIATLPALGTFAIIVSRFLPSIAVMGSSWTIMHMLVFVIFIYLLLCSFA